MAKPFEVGDVVQLMSGGPVMTIIRIDPAQGTVVVRWFKQSLEVFSKADEFPLGAVRRFEPSEHDL